MSELRSEIDSHSNRPLTGWFWLAAVLLLFLPLFGWYGFRHHGSIGIVAALVAVGVNFLAGSLALLFVPRAGQTVDGISGLMLGILFRTGVPLAAGFCLHAYGGPLADSNVLGMIMVYYLIALPAETLIAVRLIQQNPSLPKVF